MTISKEWPIKKINNNKKENHFFILKWVDNSYWKMGTIKKLNTISKKKRLSNAKEVYSLWLYNNTPNKNFYKLWYWLVHKDKLISAVLSYPLTKQGNRTYNKKFFQSIDKLDKEAIDKMILLIQLFESDNLSQIETIVIKFLKNKIDIKELVNLFWVLKPLLWKNEKNTIKRFQNLKLEDKESLLNLWITEKNAYLFIIFFHDFFNIVSMLQINNIEAIRKLFLSFLNINIVIFDKVNFPTTTEQLDQVYFSV